MQRPFVTFPDGTQQVFPATVQSPQDQQQVLALVSAVNQARLGIPQGTVMLPQHSRPLLAKVEFFRVAKG